MHLFFIRVLFESTFSKSTLKSTPIDLKIYNVKLFSFIYKKKKNLKFLALMGSFSKSAKKVLYRFQRLFKLLEATLQYIDFFKYFCYTASENYAYWVLLFYLLGHLLLQLTPFRILYAQHIF